MHIKDFQELVRSEQPCYAGEAWLEGWVNKHPNGATTEFFKWAVSKEGRDASACQCGCGTQWYVEWLEWCVWNLLEYPKEVANDPEYKLDHIAELLGKQSFTDLTVKQWVEALTNAFE